MKILIYGINFSPELTGIGKYSGEMASFYATQGHEVRVITAPPYYPAWHISKGYKNSYSRQYVDGVRITRCPLYIPSKPTALSRLLHLLSFSLSSLFPLLSSFFWKPDIVIQVVPTLFCSLQTLVLSKISGAKSVIHIQDYEVDAMFGLAIVNSGIVLRSAYWVEKKILTKFDLVSTISDSMLQQAIKKGVRPNKLVFFPNWSEIERFQNVKKNTNLLKESGVDPLKKIILYSGNMGEKQGLELVIHVAKKMELNTDTHFLMVGDGVAKARLIKFSKSLSLSNITFLPVQSYTKFPQLLALANCHLVIQKSGAADAVLPSKLTNIFAAGGNAVITADKGTSLGILCSEYDGIATLVEPESVPALHKGILRSLKMSKLNSVALGYAQNNLDKAVVLNRFLAKIMEKNINHYDN
jgi:colanic acid biosynthesis glycosyl transferase WcaI